MNVPCKCGSNKPGTICCMQFLDGSKMPSTPEELMRSRFVAFATSNVDYILKTERLDTPNTPQSLLKSCQSIRWQSLQVINSKQLENDGLVHFEASFIQEGKSIVLNEESVFKRIDEQWFYIGGKLIYKEQPDKTFKKVGRNESCPCGSGKKFKKCCI